MRSMRLRCEQGVCTARVCSLGDAARATAPLAKMVTVIKRVDVPRAPYRVLVALSTPWKIEEWFCSPGVGVFRCCSSSSRTTTRASGGKHGGSHARLVHFSCLSSARASVDQLGLRDRSAIGCWYTSLFLVLSCLIPRTCSRPQWIAMVPHWSLEMRSHAVRPCALAQSNTFLHEG